MAIYTISDLHLARAVDKPMDVFGGRWAGYMDRLKERWEALVGEKDTVIVPGDISWATYLDEALEDFLFIDALPGRKIISKGNHDYWWTTMSKLEQFLDNHSLKSIRFMHNNSYLVDGMVLCGTRGWKCPGDEEFGSEDRKIYQRELHRLELSLKSAMSFEKDILVALHYPPFNTKKEPSEFVQLMVKYGVKDCIYGHLHGESCSRAVEGTIEGVCFRLVSADHLAFEPICIHGNVE